MTIGDPDPRAHWTAHPPVGPVALGSCPANLTGSMPTLPHFKRRRAQFLEAIDTPVLLMAGGRLSRNYPANWYPFRADSTFQFFFPEPEPGAAALFDPEDGSVTLFLAERTPEDALWHGSQPSFDDMKQGLSVTAVQKRADLAALVHKKVGKRRLSALAVHDPKATATAAEISGQQLDFFAADKIGDPKLIAALAKLRLRRDPEELQEMRSCAAVTREAHVVAMAKTRPGLYEQDLVGHVEGTFARHGCVPAYNTILTVRGEVLHNNAHGNMLLDTDI